MRILSRDSLRLSISMFSKNVPAIRIDGIPGRPVTLEYKNALLPATSWQTLINFMLTNGSDVFVDANAPTSHPRFYRAWQGP